MIQITLTGNKMEIFASLNELFRHIELLLPKNKDYKNSLNIVKNSIRDFISDCVQHPSSLATNSTSCYPSTEKKIYTVFSIEIEVSKNIKDCTYKVEVNSRQQFKCKLKEPSYKFIKLYAYSTYVDDDGEVTLDNDYIGVIDNAGNIKVLSEDEFCSTYDIINYY